MVCKQCGHDNPGSAKFCNECGALAEERRKGERRQADRRKALAGAASRRLAAVPSITPGQENAQGHSPARQAAEAYLRKDRPFRGPDQMPVEDARESGAPVHARVAPRGNVSGPSFLGLADAPPSSGEYLLEDEHRSHWRAWAVVLLLLLLGVLGYLQWKTNWRAQPTQPPPAQEQSAPTSSQQPQGSAAPASEATGIPAAAPQNAAKTPAPAPQPPAKDAAPAAAPDHSQSGDASAKAAPEKSDAAPSDSAEEDQPEKTEETPAAKPAPRSKLRPSKPAAERDSVEPRRDPMVLMAQRYLYGQGVRRDCDQAMVYLRAANQKASAEARSQMGALYATGYCVPLDRVRAYQWFTSALNVEPANPALQRERNNLWTQMSSDERQQAVK